MELLVVCDCVDKICRHVLSRYLAREFGILLLEISTNRKDGHHEQD
nr:MAG TPA: hypothetical protein [Caudoviricetes sp.]